MSSLSHADPVVLGRAFAAFLMLLLGCFLAALVGMGEWETLAITSLIFVALAFVLWFHRYTWQIALLICFIDLTYRPLIFAITSLELTVLIGVALAVLYSWRRAPRRELQWAKGTGFRFMQWALLAWCGYLVLHMAYNWWDPFLPSEFRLQNFVKSYFSALAPFALLLYFSQRPVGIETNTRIFWRITQLLFVAIIVDLAIRAYQISVGLYTLSPQQQPGAIASSFFIPGINAFDNPYTLRWVGPLAVLIGVAGFFSRQPIRTPLAKILFAVLTALGVIGSLFSGGRAAILLALVFAVTVLLMNRRILALAGCVLAGCIFIGFVNFIGDWVEDQAHPIVQRSVALVLLDKPTEATTSIQSSSDWRVELFEMAVDEWLSTPRIFFFGRATYGYGAEDFIALQTRGGYEAGKESSLRRGATHNQITDLLVPYGLVGLVFFYVMTIAIIFFLWRLYRTETLSSWLKDLVLVTLISGGVYLIYGVFTAETYHRHQFWFLIVIFAALYNHRLQARPKPSSQLTPPVEPRFTRPREVALRP